MVPLSWGVFVWDNLFLEKVRLDGVERDGTFTDPTESFRNEIDEAVTELYVHA